MAAAPVTIKLTQTVIDDTGESIQVPLVLTGNALEKCNIDIAPNTTKILALPIVVNAGLKGLVLSATSASLTLTFDDDDEIGDATYALLKGHPLIYYPGGPVVCPITKRVKRITAVNADPLRAATFHYRCLRAADVIGDED